MKVLLVLVELLAIWVWWTAMVVSSAGEYPKISFGGYTSFIQDLRNKLKGPTTVQNIPVTKDPSTVTKPQERYLLVELHASEQQFVTLVVDVTDLYVLGYKDRYQEKDRAHYFEGYKDIIKNIFSAAGTTYNGIPFGFSYKDLANEGASRTGSKLGIESLKTAILSVYGKDLNGKRKIEAKFLVTAIQMVSEAARFKYIEDRIGQQAEEQAEEAADDCAIGLENSWDKLSKAIQNGGKLDKNFQLDACSKLKGKREDALKKAIINEGFMGILKYNKAKVLYYPD